MIDELETLRLLKREGSMTRAATRLRITQSTASKRIQALELKAKKKLVVPQGRGVRLTPAGERLLQRAVPLLGDLRAIFSEEAVEGEGRISLALSESILGSWGAQLIVQAQKAFPKIEFELHAHRSLTVIDRVRSGECLLGICSGRAEEAPDLLVHELGEEKMVIVPSALDPQAIPSRGRVSVAGIELGSATGAVLQRRLQRRPQGSTGGMTIEVTQTLESYGCLVELAKQGYFHAWVPRGIAKSFGIKPNQWISPKPSLTRPVSLIGRPSVLSLGHIQVVTQLLSRVSVGLLD
jgi:DNA-binding transcriptional LysR family regulator